MKNCFIYKELIEFKEVNACSAVKAFKKFVNFIKLNFDQDIEVGFLLELKKVEGWHGRVAAKGRRQISSTGGPPQYI